MTVRLLIVSSVFLFLFMGAGAIQPYLTAYFESCSMTREQAAAALALVYFAFAVMRFFSGAAVHFTGIKRAIILGAFTYFLFIILVIAFPNCYVAAGAAIMWGIGAAFLWTGGSTYILNISKEGRYGFSAGVQRLFLQIGIIVGFIILARLIGQEKGKQNFKAGFTFAVIACSIGFGLTFFLSGTTAKPKKLNVKQAFRNVFSRRLVPLYICLFTAGIGYGIILNVFNRYIKVQYGFEGYVFTITFFYIAGGLFSLLMGAVSDKKGRDLFIAGAFVCGILAGILILRVKIRMSLASASFMLGIMFQVVPTIVTAKIGDIAGPEERPGVVAGVFIYRDIGIAGCILFAGMFEPTASNLDKILYVLIPLFGIAGLAALPAARKARQSSS